MSENFADQIAILCRGIKPVEVIDGHRQIDGILQELYGSMGGWYSVFNGQMTSTFKPCHVASIVGKRIILK